MEALVRRPRLIKERGLEKGLKVGKGFSRKELEEAGLSIKDALKLGIRVDIRRRSAHEWNVKALREYLEKSNGCNTQ